MESWGPVRAGSLDVIPTSYALANDAALPPCDERLMELWRHWRSIRPAPDLLPGRRHFDPMRVSTLLPWLWLVDLQREPLRFKYRLVGTKHVEVMGRDMTGEWLDQAHAGFAASPTGALFEKVATEGAITHFRGVPSYPPTSEVIVVETLALPLAGNGKDVDMLLCMTVLDPRRPRNQAAATG